MQKSFFRAYDMRGIVGSECIIEDMYALGHAIIYFMSQQGSMPTRIALARDGRIHSVAIAEEIIRSFIDAGITVIDFGLCPTPTFYFGLYHQPLDGGVMVTASHNGAAYNGLKICLGTRALSAEEIQEIRRYYEQGMRVSSLRKGSSTPYPQGKVYIDWLVHHFKQLNNYSEPLVFDCGNGATGVIIPELCERLNLNAEILFADIDGSFPHHEADPTIVANMREVQKLMPGKCIGFGFDGDGDRVGVMTHSGELLAGDMVVALFAEDILRNNPHSTIITDIKTSYLTRRYIQSHKGNHVFSPVGHTTIKMVCKREKAVLAGELSGHFIFNDRYFGYDDGIYASLRLLEIVQKNPDAIHKLQKRIGHSFITPEYRIACPEEEKRTLISSLVKELYEEGCIVITMDGYRLEFPTGWILIRASHTQPVISVRAEFETHEELEKKLKILTRLVEEKGKGNLHKESFL